VLNWHHAIKVYEAVKAQLLAFSTWAPDWNQFSASHSTTYHARVVTTKHKTSCQESNHSHL